jgi:peptidoglycan/xylan/chitin deacetylase (PgdA/CDA1 family)
LRFAPVKTPLVVKKMLPNYVWDIATDEQIIYLTFDDGPTPDITEWTLKTLSQFNAKATFFCIGNNIEKHPEIFQKVLNDGHSIGNHTHNHIKGWKTSTEDYVANVLKAEKVINSEFRIQNSEFKVNLFRPPYGQLKNKQGKALRKLGYNIIMWDVIAFDWEAAISSEKCLNNVLTKTENGSIVVFHDSVKASKHLQYALPKMLAYFSEKGFVFKAIE